jgi:hypothetical protein
VAGGGRICCPGLGSPVVERAPPALSSAGRGHAAHHKRPPDIRSGADYRQAALRVNANSYLVRKRLQRTDDQPNPAEPADKTAIGRQAFSIFWWGAVFSGGAPNVTLILMRLRSSGKEVAGMATVQTTAAESPIPQGVPELRAGDRLTRAEFERRYAAMPHVKKA